MTTESASLHFDAEMAAELSNLQSAMERLLTEPFPCSLCKRTVPADLVVTHDCSGCPLAVPCVKKGHGFITAWPGQPPDDDDDDDRDPAEPKPVVPGVTA